MSNGIIALIVAGSTVGYFVVSGIFQKPIAERYDPRSDLRGPWGMLWPVVGPWLVGEWFTAWFTRPKLPKATVVSK